MTSGPPTSKPSPKNSSRPHEAARYATTSSSAIGWVGVETQRGQTIAGRRSTSARMVSKAALPAPTTMAARSVVTGVLPEASASPVSMRLRRCGERSGASSPSPPR